MKKIKVAVLGGGGMLGSMVLDVFSQNNVFNIIATVRSPKEANYFRDKYPKVDFLILDVEWATPDALKKKLQGANWIINAIGIIKPYIHNDNPAEVERAIRINSLFPHYLARAARDNKARVIQIATDCVYSGGKGKYRESDLHDADDVYGKTKSLGESYYYNIHHLRCSIIGPEPSAHVSLMDWFITQPKNAKVMGFKNHFWNGITTYHFALICRGIIKKNLKLDHLQHIVPADIITKADLLKEFAKKFKRNDIDIKPIDAPNFINRTIATEYLLVNTRLWRAAGYKKPLTIKQMVKELARWEFDKSNTQ